MSRTPTGRAVIYPKEQVEYCSRIDIAKLKKEGILNRLAELGSYDITYRSLKSGFEGRDSFRLTSTPCYFGGKRYWFLCPGCNRRVRILYLPPFRKLFRCRNCHDLTYEARQEHRKMFEPFNRVLANYRRIKELLDSSDSGVQGLSKREWRRFYKLQSAMHKWYSIGKRMKDV